MNALEQSKLPRSMLVVPAVNDSYLKKIFSFSKNEKPDALILDIEDSVEHSFKSQARENIIKLCRDCIQIRDCFELIVRINSARSVYFKDDLKLLKEVKPNMIGMTKVESSSEVAKCKNFTGINVAFVAIETIHGYENRDEIVSKLVAGDRLIMGYEDVSSELQIERPSLQTLNPLSFILMNTIVTAKKYSIPMYDAVCRYYKSRSNLVILEKEAVFTRNLGLCGKVCIHPSQIKIVNKVFDRKAATKKCKQLIDKFESVENGLCVINKNKNEMIDAPSYRMYKKIVKFQ